MNDGRLKTCALGRISMTRILFASTAAMALAASGAVAQSLPFEPGEEDRFNWENFEAFSAENDFSGQTLTISGPWTGLDAQNVQQMLLYFAEATGATVSYSGSDSFEQDIVIAAQAGSPPNIAVFPQPGLAEDMAGRGFLEPLDDATGDWLRENYAAGESWVDLATFEGPGGDPALYGFFYKVDVKSLVWYSPEQFDEAGYDVPATMEELRELTEMIVEDGGTPWCIGLGSGAATGWPATDWVEDLMLRLHEPEIYDQWVSNELAFDSPEVVEAIEAFGWFARNNDFVHGGASAVATTDFRDAPSGLFSFPPQCYMHKQASFIPTFFPEGAEYPDDWNFFYFPAYEERDLGNPVLGAGTLFTITRDSEVARAFIEWLKKPIAHEVWMGLSGFLTPHQGVNPEAFDDDSLRAMNEILLEATTFRFDASDLMPGEIGAGAFWTAMVDYVGGAEAAAVGRQVQTRWEAMR
jgi:alpha-glucoside transport system substrate-binding protein